jgi:preprotein translocase subunit SecD
MLLIATSIYADETPVFDVTPADVTHASVVYGMSETPMLEIHFTGEAAQRFAQFTRTNLMKTVAIQVAGESVSEPTVREVIPGPSLQLSVDTEDKAIALAQKLTKKQ